MFRLLHAGREADEGVEAEEGGALRSTSALSPQESLSALTPEPEVPESQAEPRGQEDENVDRGTSLSTPTIVNVGVTDVPVPKIASSPPAEDPKEGEGVEKRRESPLPSAPKAQETRRTVSQSCYDVESINKGTVSRLGRSLEEAHARIAELEAELRAARGVEGKGAPRAQTEAQLTGLRRDHRGHWVMDTDSTDFLALDDELKTNLRNEKARRLEEVQSSMRFILVTDDVSSSHGEWDCCSATEYGAEGCCSEEE